VYLAFSAVMQGYLLTVTNYLDRALLIAASILLILSGLTTDMIGFGLIIVVALLQIARKKKSNTLSAA
jgi:TRAP-type uncharacterized transport system fused permease subunit